jgi:hypothetical protein
MTAPSNPSPNILLHPGDIANAIRELDLLAKFCRMAATDYRNEPAPDDIARRVRDDRVRAAENRAASFDRINLLLASHLVPPKEPAHALS